MPTFSLVALRDQLRAIGRGSVFYGDQWDGTGAIELTHLGDTEGEISMERNDEYSDMRLPELTGPAVHDRFYSGEDPQVTIPLYLADPSLRAIISPTGSASAGYERRRRVKEYTLWIVPEEFLFDAALNAGDGGYGTVTIAPTGIWQVGGVALTARAQELLGLGVWLWRGHFQMPNFAFRHEDAGKAVDPVTFQVMQDLSKPDGHQLYTLGDPFEVGIDLLDEGP